MDRRDIDWERLDRYVTGEGTPEEREALDRWVASDPVLETVAAVMRTAQRRPETAANKWDAGHAWDAVTERLGLQGDLRGITGGERVSSHRGNAKPPVLQLTTGGSMRHRSSRLGLAAVAAAVFVVAGAGWWIDRPSAAHPSSLATSPTAGLEYVTRRGERRVVYLPDRTQVTLAPESSIRLAPDYGRRARFIDLQGQAYFDVAHDSKRPFVVRAGPMVAQDLGTRFVVRAYPGDATSTVVVAEGLVKLDRAGASDLSAEDGLLLAAGDMGRLTTDSLVRVRDVPVGRYITWTAGELQFHHSPLREVVADLSRWYDVDIALLDSSFGAERVTASLKNQPLLAAIDQVASASGLVVEQRGMQFTLHRKRD